MLPSWTYKIQCWLLGLGFVTFLAFNSYSLSQDINKNSSIAAALAYEEKFFRDNPVIITFLLYCIG
jgi:hypothetical protein